MTAPLLLVLASRKGLLDPPAWRGTTHGRGDIELNGGSAVHYNQRLALEITIKGGAQLGSCAKQQAFDRGNRQSKNRSDFLVALVLVTAEHDRHSLLLR